MEISISRKVLSRIALISGIPLLIAMIYLIGQRVTPYDDDNQPVLLSPSVRAALFYRSQAAGWLARFQALDTDLSTLQAEQDVYEQTRQAEAILSSSARLAQEIEQARTPPALVGLRALLAETASYYLASAQAAAQWVGAPSPENKQFLNDTLAEARAALERVSSSRWLAETDTNPLPPSSTPGDGLDLPQP